MYYNQVLLVDTPIVELNIKFVVESEHVHEIKFKEERKVQSVYGVEFSNHLMRRYDA